MTTGSPVQRPAPSLVRRLLPSLVVLVAVPLCIAAVFMWQQHERRMGELIAEDADELGTDLAMILRLQTDGLATTAQSIANDAQVQRFLRERDAQGLLAAWQPAFTAMFRDKRIINLNFCDRDRICLARLNSPGQRGDRIQQHTMLEAERSGRTASGLEVGPRGNISLRVVQPVAGPEGPIGYVEVAKDFEDALDTLKEHMEEWRQMAVIVHKDRLDRQAWEDSQLVLGREADWDFMPHHVLALASQGHLPEVFAAWVDPSGQPTTRRGDGQVTVSERVWRIMDTPLRGAAGAEIGDLLAMRDITDDRNSLLWRLAIGGSAALAVAVVLAFVHRLLVRADQRITAQQEETLRLQQQKMARELGELMHANRLVALGTLMAGLAHEFNHPAQVVLLNQKSLRCMVEACADAAKGLEGPAVGLLSWSEVAAIAPQLLDDMELATSQLSELIENVQNYARPSEGLCHAISYPMLTAVSRSSLRMVASYARRCQVALVDEVEAADEPQAGCGCLQQIVINLLINAIQASPPGGSVSIACQRSGGSISLTVSDSGPGIDPEVLAKLGQPFNTTRKAQGGNGLGLFICRQIVAEQGGRLELTPREPRGTMARVVYPDANPA